MGNRLVGQRLVILLVLSLILCSVNLFWIWRQQPDDESSVAEVESPPPLRKGRQVVLKRDSHYKTRSIHRVSMQDLDVVGNITTSTLSWEELQLRKPIIRLLANAGIEELDIPVLAHLPTWKQVTQLYGPSPVLVGSGPASCQAFRTNVSLQDRMGAVAGLFNTGTNALWLYLRNNLKLPTNVTTYYDSDPPFHTCRRFQCDGFLERVPWDKHYMLRPYRETYNCVQNYHPDTDPECHHYDTLNKDHILPIVIVRDPFTWMQSMCQNSYFVTWARDKREHCPNLVLNDTTKTNPVYYPQANHNHSYPSLVDLWIDWYSQYLETTTPRLMIRLEDLFFHPQQVVEGIQQCLGADWKDPDTFQYIVDTSKANHEVYKKQTNMISGIMKYGSGKSRFKGMTQADLDYAFQRLKQSKLMEVFSYQSTPPHV